MDLNQNQQRIYDWMKEELGLPIFADSYKGALDLLVHKSDGFISLVSHVGRDLMNNLATTSSKIKNSGHAKYSGIVSEIVDIWEEKKIETTYYEYDSKDDEPFFPVPYDICEKISNLVCEHKKGTLNNSEKEILFFTTFLDYSDKDKIPIDDWSDARKWFVARAHLRKGEFSEQDYNELVKHFNTLNDYLYIAATSQYERIRNLNDILEETNG